LLKIYQYLNIYFIKYNNFKPLFILKELIGGKFDESLDMWYLGCVCAELFLGLPLFPSNSYYDQLRRIIDFLGFLTY
jgi:hypothetical protein